jgi:UDP-glucuronate 4-epimerase
LIKTNNPILVTGAAGFIGYHLSRKLLEEGFEVVGLDIVNDYYDVQLKEERVRRLLEQGSFQFARIDLCDRTELPKLFNKHQFEFVINLAAQAGVRYSLINPFAYTESNITGFVNLLEQCKAHKVKHLLYASSSSVYGANTSMPFSTDEPLAHPMSIYAATKKANELIAHSYSSSAGLPTTGLRFFTVYGPWGRPDMALFLFTKAILEDKPIDVFNNGKMMRDFTYIDDIVESVFRLIDKVPVPDPKWNAKTPMPDASYCPYQIFNVGNNSPVELMRFIEAIEQKLDKKAEINYLPLQVGDVPHTFANVDKLMEVTGFKPSTSVEAGIEAFIDWYISYYNK